MVLVFGCLFLFFVGEMSVTDDLYDGVEFAFYQSGKKLDTMPNQNNEEGVVFLRSDCTNGALVEWNYENWNNFKVINLSDSKTTCSFYFGSKEEKICNDSGLESAACYFANKEDDDLIYDDTYDTNLRYIGLTPNNYVYFNCDESRENCETWRIIGVMNNVTEVSEDGKNIETLGSHLKIIRDKFEKSYSWDSSERGVNNGYGVNEWSQAAIEKVLNDEYLNRRTGSNRCYKSSGISIETCPDWETVGIKDDARNMIANIKWNIGTIDEGWLSNFFENNEKFNANVVYGSERSSHNGKELCEAKGGDYCNDVVVRNKTWIGKVGLMYPSDFGYAVGMDVRDVCLGKSIRLYYTDNCATSDWLYDPSSNQWTIMPIPRPENASYVSYIHSSGFVSYNRTDYNYTIRPVVYLKSDVKIVDRDYSDYGSSNHPFELEF